MGRLLAVLAERPLSFSRWLRAVRESSPSFPEGHFETSVAAICCASGGGWETVGDETSMASAPPGVALVGHVRARYGAASTSQPPRSGLARQGSWVFAHDGTIEDYAYLESRISRERRAASGETSDGARLLAFLLTRLDERASARVDAADSVDHALVAGASELARRIGTLSFVLSDGCALYAYRFDRSMHFLERRPTAAEAGALLVASEPLTSDAWTQLGSRTLLSGRRGEGLELRFLSGLDPRGPHSDVELPFTD